MPSRGKQSFYQAAKLGGFRNQGPKGSSDMVVGNVSNSKTSGDEGIPMQTLNESRSSENLPETSEPSLLLSEKTRSVLYAALPVIVQGRKWMLLYSTWRHGISLSTLYRRSMLWPGLSLLVVGDRNGAVFGGLVEAPLRPTNRRRYQGSNNSFVFTNTSGHPLIFRPTGHLLACGLVSTCRASDSTCISVCNMQRHSNGNKQIANYGHME
ncbi:UNVERIFIED_CONTAM: hypothetical protein Slati_1431900 [Sesamum latifolium]|uniref:Oxidation resistance protein 1 n=1 Tax=Sesamum latifolium TaxID=2727402 RepID=A0AAW2X999_9LAMI